MLGIFGLENCIVIIFLRKVFGLMILGDFMIGRFLLYLILEINSDKFGFFIFLVIFL